jgi:type IV pilus assembly protein PilW
MYNHSKKYFVITYPRMNKISTPAKRQLGASILELMVGIAIGLLVVVAAIGSLVYTRVASTTMVDSTRLQQKADAAFRLINFQTLQAGSLEFTPTSDPATVVFSTDYTGYDPTVTTLPTNIVSVHGVNGDGTTTRDVLRISYQDNSTATTPVTSRDCLGQTTALVNRGIIVQSQFTFVPTVGGGGNLTCAGSASETGSSTEIPQSILDGVEDFQVTYGVRTVLPSGVENFRFFTADTITDWTNIQAISICLQIRGDTSGNPQPGAANIVGCSGGVLNDGRLRRVYNRTFSLRNALL